MERVKGMVNCLPKQPQDVSNEPYIFELQKKKLPFNVTLSKDFLQSRPDLLLQLKNIKVETIPNDDTKRDDLKRRSVPLHEHKPNKNAKVTSDSIAEKGGEITRKYCIPHSPITVISNKGELTLVERNKVNLKKDEMVLTPSPRKSSSVSSDQIMPSASSIVKRRKRSKNSKGSDDSMSSNGKSSDSSEGSGQEGQDMDVDHSYIPVLHPLQKELLHRNSFDNLDFFKDYFEHAYSKCERTKGGERCRLGSNCKGPETKDYVDREMEKIASKPSLVENENHQQIVYALFHHSMECYFKSCFVPLCTDFKKSMKDILQNSGADGHQSNSPSKCADLMKVVYSNTSHFQESNKDGGGHNAVMEGKDFNFLYEKYINKGSFGFVYDTWLATSKGQTRVAVKKSGKNFCSKHLKVKAEPFLDLRKGPNLLFPDVILQSKNGFCYMLMEKAETSLSEYCQRQFQYHKEECNKEEHYSVCNGGLNPNVCSVYFYQMARGLKYLHDHGYTHGDIKPDNVLIMPGLQQVKLCDFDFLKKEEEQMSSGTPGYDAPEVCDPSFKNVVKSSDVYSLCCCLPEMLIVFPMKAKLKDAKMKERTASLAKHLLQLDQHLGVIYEQGTQWDHTLRPCVDLIIECFERNNEMRQRKLTVVGMDASAPPPVDNVVNDADTTLSRKILDHWIDDIMNRQLQQYLSPIKPDDHSDENFNMEIPYAEERREDVPLLEILSQGMPANSPN